MRVLSIRLLSIACLSAVTTLVEAQQAGPAMTNPLFAKPVELRGKLGAQQIRMYLQPKTEDRDSVEGSYVIVHAGKLGQKILLAGEVTADKLSMEESIDGTDVSGQWDGDLHGNVVRGVWLSADGTIHQDFALELVPLSKSKQISNNGSRKK
ncbi:hypothetical protein ACO0LB_15950 [Undibacterium sp. SXout7W]|uniref:hypothetical protein n=1 Tax=Undibacterium sp. SXout7W TaxID=3413049 RepID=UPI003BF0F891